MNASQSFADVTNALVNGLTDCNGVVVRYIFMNGADSKPQYFRGTNEASGRLEVVFRTPDITDLWVGADSQNEREARLLLNQLRSRRKYRSKVIQNDTCFVEHFVFC